MDDDVIARFEFEESAHGVAISSHESLDNPLANSSHSGPPCRARVPCAASGFRGSRGGSILPSVYTTP